MNTITKKNKNDKIKDFQIKNFKFYWIFEGNGEYAQKHDEIDYRRFVERNYESKSNQDF